MAPSGELCLLVTIINMKSSSGAKPGLTVHYKGFGFPKLKMKFQLSYLKPPNMMLLKCCSQYVSKFGKLSSGLRTGKGQFSFQSHRRAMLENVLTTIQLCSSHMLAK